MSFVIKNDSGLDMRLSGKVFEFIESEDINFLRLIDLLDTVFVSAESIGSMDESNFAGDIFKHKGPIESGVTASNDEEFFISELIGVFNGIEKFLFFKGYDIGDFGFTRGESACADGHNSGVGEERITLVGGEL